VFFAVSVCFSRPSFREARLGVRGRGGVKVQLSGALQVARRCQAGVWGRRWGGGGGLYGVWVVFLVPLITPGIESVCSWLIPRTATHK
jgi:hypothetical protein